jgi:hypothetical protein
MAGAKVMPPPHLTSHHPSSFAPHHINAAPPCCQAVEVAGGPRIEMRYCRVDADPSAAGADPAQQQRRGAAMAAKLPCANPPYPDGAHSAEFHIRTVFYRMGFSSREVVALCGAHTIGRAFKDRYACEKCCALPVSGVARTLFDKRSLVSLCFLGAGLGCARSPRGTAARRATRAPPPSPRCPLSLPPLPRPSPSPISPHRHRQGAPLPHPPTPHPTSPRTHAPHDPHPTHVPSPLAPPTYSRVAHVPTCCPG